MPDPIAPLHRVPPIPQDLADRLLAAVDRRAPELLALAGDLIRTPSVNPDLSPNPDAEAPAQHLLRDTFARWASFDTVDLWEHAPNRPNLVAKRTGAGGPGARSLTWSAHTDVVPVTPEQAERWTGGDPFSGHVEDGWLWGRGASDMKGAIAAYALAAQVLADEGVVLMGDLTLAQSCGEEAGRRDIGCDTVLERGYRSDVAIFPEPTDFAVYPTAKGELYFKLTVPGKSTHICNRHLVSQPLPHGQERPGVSAIDNMLKYQLATLELERQWTLWRTSPHVPPGGMFVSINTLQAGTSLTSVPDSAEATGSLLFHPELTGAQVIAEVRACYDRVTQADDWLRDHPPTLDLPLDSASAAPWLKEPVNLPHDHPLIAVCQDAAERARGERPAVTVSPFVCDANFWFPKGQDCLIWGIGSPTYGIHGTDERIPVQDLVDGAKAFALATVAWCGLASTDGRS